MAVLVTGRAGYVGTTVVKRLLERGTDIVSIDNLYHGDYNYLDG